MDLKRGWMKTEGARRDGYARGGEVPEPRGEEDDESSMVDCPACGHRFAHGGEVPEPEGEEMKPENKEGFMAALRRKRG